MKRVSSIWSLTDSHFTIQLFVFGFLALSMFGMHMSTSKIYIFKKEMLTF